MSKKIGLISLGCHKNLVDSENILGYLESVGYEVTSDIEESDIVIINTCGFIEAAKRESINTILEALKLEGKKVVVTGCLAERYLDDLKKEIPEVSKYIPLRDYKRFNKEFMEVDNNPLLCNEVDITKYRLLTSEVTGVLRIGEGCNNHCAFCAIPLIRGPFHSRSLADIKEEAELLAARGIKEVVILEQDTSSYGNDLKEDVTIVDVLKTIYDIEGIKMIRLLYLYPDEISDEFIEYVATHPKVVPYFDIPIQHSEDHILKAMGRRGNKKYITNLINKIRDRVPNAILRTTLMVGFYNESEEDVDHLIDYCKEINFDHVGVFTYSLEEGTPAYKYGDPISKEEKERRRDKVMEALSSLSRENNKKYIGEELEGLVVSKDKDTYLIRTYLNAFDDVDGKVIMKGKREHALGDEVRMKVSHSYTYDLYGVELI
ncbi:MAG: 30S ribosomal protein S12 methylthiotransferase RimO [Coprobacillus sp.]|nr:30S ribosomal protein S12 methylthiotransferase RimO [Coprobacillus sp.]